MATHDYVIDNSTGANVRADINNVLQAILTNNSSSSAPSTTAAYMWWADTTNGVLKIRNSSNNAWVELFQLDGTLTLEDGSASTPGLAFRDDLNTGIFSSGEDVFNIATAGVEKLRITNSAIIFNEDGNNVDFRIEGDTQAHLFFLDAGNDVIGIGRSDPTFKLDIYEGTGNGLRVQSGDASADLSLSIGSASTADKFVVTAGGKVGIGISPSQTLDILGDSSSNLPLKWIRGGSSVAGHLYSDGGGSGIVGSDGTLANTGIYLVNNSNIDFRVAGGQRVRIDADGIKFSGDTLTANGLDDYEEGGWTALLGGGNFTATQQYMKYTKIGRFVILSGEFSSFSSTTNSSTIDFTGAPFASSSGDSFLGAINTSAITKHSGFTNPQACRIGEGTTTMTFQYGGEDSNTRFSVRYSDLSSSSVIQFTLVYMTAT